MAVSTPQLTQRLTQAKPGSAFVVPPLAASGPSLRLSLIIPTFNEVASLAALVAQLDQRLRMALPQQYEIIVVDDNSLDGTAQLAAQLTQQYPAVKLLCRPRERGLATAVVRGWQQAEGEYLAVMDGDFQHPPSVISELLEALRQGASVAVASRYVELAQGRPLQAHWTGRRRSLSHLAQLIGRLLLPRIFNRLSDPLSGCFALRRDVIAGRSLHPMGYKILLEVLGRGSAESLVEVGYEFGKRQRGASKASARQAGLYLLHLLRLRWSQGLNKACDGDARSKTVRVPSDET